MGFLVRTGFVTGVAVAVVALASALWAEYSARESCASAGDPATPSRIVAGGASAALVDKALPEYQIGEKHSIFIDAPPERVFESLERDTGGEHPILGLFDLLKVLGEGGASSLREAEKPVLVWLREGNDVLERPSREVVVVNDGTGAVSFRVEPEEDGSRVTTETRVKFDDENSCRNFGRYWSVIYPGSSLHRVYLLETIRHRVEATSSTDSQDEHPKTSSDGGTT